MADQPVENKVSECSFLVNSVGTEDDDDGWIPVGGRGDRVVSDPAIDLRPIGGKSKFLTLADDDESDEEFDQSPYTPDLVRQAAVHGFGMEKLVEAEMALQDSSIQRRVEASSSPASSDTKVVLMRNIIKAWTARRRPSLTPWSGKLPRPRASPAMTLGDCTATLVRDRRATAGGTLAEVLERSSPSSPAKSAHEVHEDCCSSLFQNQSNLDPFSAPCKQWHAGSVSSAGTDGTCAQRYVGSVFPAGTGGLRDACDASPCRRSIPGTETGGPSETQRGLCVLDRCGRRRARIGKLASRFLLASCDLDEINKLTLAATPSSVRLSYV